MIFNLYSPLFTGTRRYQLESIHGPEPLENDMSAYSLWLTSVSPLRDGTKMIYLKSRNIRERLDMCVETLSAFITTTVNEAEGTEAEDTEVEGTEADQEGDSNDTNDNNVITELDWQPVGGDDDDQYDTTSD